MRHRTCGQALKITNVESQLEPLWAVVANIAKLRPFGPKQVEVKSGTKQFRGGTRVVCFPQEWGDGGISLRVLGPHRWTRKTIACIVRTEFLDNARVKMIYAPNEIDRLSGFWDRTDVSNAKATDLARLISWASSRRAPIVPQDKA